MKTRAWDGERFRDDYIVKPDGSVWNTNIRGDGIVYKQAWKLSRFTGLCDRNGEEIYENDIIKIGDIKYVVKLDKSVFGLDQITVVPNPYRDLRVLPSLYRHLDETEIIGSIFENPELLEVNP